MSPSSPQLLLLTAVVLSRVPLWSDLQAAAKTCMNAAETIRLHAAAAREEEAAMA